MYIKEGVVSSSWLTDASHIAITAVNGLDFMNLREGFNPIGIYKPAEVLEIYEDGTGIPD